MKTNNSDKKLRRFNEMVNHAEQQEKNGSYENAALSYLKAARLLNKHEETEGIIFCLINAAENYIYNTDVIKNKAEKCLIEALNLNEKIHGENHPDSSFIYMSLTKLYFQIGDVNKAEFYGEKSLKIDNNNELKDIVLNAMGAIQLAKGNLDKAEKYCNDAVSFSKCTYGYNHKQTIEYSKHLDFVRKLKILENEKKENQAALHQANRLAYLGQMATMMAHNINNPVGIIRMKATGAMQDIKDNLFDANTELQPLLTSIIEQTERLNSIINNFRQFSRGDRNKLTATNLNTVINDIYALLFTAPYQMDKIELEKQFTEPAPIAHSNEFALQEILISLLSNARAALKDKENKIVLIRTWQENNQVGFDIEDSGEGILEEQRDKLFTPFLSSKQEGMGLGLYFCKEICKDLGGNIEYYPAPQGGAGFRITLPIQQDNEHGT